MTANRPSGSESGSLPHSNGSAFTGLGLRGAISDGIQGMAPATSPANPKTIRRGTYSIRP